MAMTKMKEKTTRRMRGPTRGSAVFSSECWFLTDTTGLRRLWPAAMKKRKWEGGSAVTAKEGGGEWSVTEWVSVSEGEHMDGECVCAYDRQVVFYVNSIFTYNKAVTLWHSPPEFASLVVFLLLFQSNPASSWNSLSPALPVQPAQINVN